jgi:hypothetical protein
MPSYPPGWRQYMNLVADQGQGVGQDVARFAARYRIARQFRGIEFDGGIAHATADGYSTAMHLGLAYSTLEACERAMKVPSQDRLSIPNSALASRLRGARFERFRSALLEPPMSPKLEERLRATFDGHPEDTRPVAERMRHAVFHGSFTLHGGGSTASAAVREFIAELAEAVLRRAEDAFRGWAGHSER